MNNTALAVLSTAYLPPVDYFRIIRSHEVWQLEQWENYQKQSYRSRCVIYSANGPLSLVIPIERRDGISVPIREVKIDYSKNWQINHWRAIVSAYRSSPYFDYYQDDFAPFYNNRYERLFDFNSKLTSLLLDLTGASSAIMLTDRWEESHGESDYRFNIHPKRESPCSVKEKGRYHQVFAQKQGFIANLSVIDLLFNEGPESYIYL